MSVLDTLGSSSSSDQERTLPLVLNCYEVAFLMDSVGVTDTDRGNADSPYSEELLGQSTWLVLSGAYLDLVQDKGFETGRTVTVQVTAKQVRLFFSKVSTTTMYIVKEPPLGPALCRKLLKLMQDFDNGADRLHSSAMEVDTGEIVDYDRANVVQALKDRQGEK